MYILLRKRTQHYNVQSDFRSEFYSLIVFDTEHNMLDLSNFL